MATVTPIAPIPQGGYHRTFDGEIDNHSESEIRVRGVLEDNRYSIEHLWTLRTPQYEVVEATARNLARDPAALSPEPTRRYPEIRWVRIGRNSSPGQLKKPHPSRLGRCWAATRECALLFMPPVHHFGHFGCDRRPCVGPFPPSREQAVVLRMCMPDMCLHGQINGFCLEVLCIGGPANAPAVLLARVAGNCFSFTRRTALISGEDSLRKLCHVVLTPRPSRQGA